MVTERQLWISGGLLGLATVTVLLALAKLIGLL